MAEKKIILTPEEREKLEREYRDLLDVQQPDIVAKLALARSQGDLSENADYDAARDRQAQLEARIKELENIFNNAVSAEEVGATGTGKKIGIGDTVTYVEKLTGEETTVRIVGNVGADPFGNPPTVSNESPVGVALLGHEIGDSVFVESAKRYEIEIKNFVR